MEILRILCREPRSPLPARMRNPLARVHQRLSAMSRELRRAPERIRNERAREEP